MFGENMEQETYKKIICYLATRKEATQYEIAKDKDVDLTYAPIHQAIEELLFKGLIEETKKEAGQGPLPKRFFKLTFSGVITALALFSIQEEANTDTEGPEVEDESEVVDSKVKRALRETIMVQREFYPGVKIFSEWEFLERIFNDGVIEAYKDQLYSYLMFAAIDWFRKFKPLEGIDKTLLKKELREEYRKDLLYWSGAHRMKPGFTRKFFRILIAYIQEEGALKHLSGSTPNRVLHDYIEGFYMEEKRRMLARIEKMEKGEELLLRQFS